MSKSEPNLRLIGVAAKGAYDRAEAATTAKGISEASDNAKDWSGADGQLTKTADDAIEAAEAVYATFDTARDVNHKADLAAIVVMAGNTTEDVLALIDADNDLDVLLGQREAAYAAAWAAEGEVEGAFAEFSAIFSK
jgi:hypothetical protein